MNEGLDIFYPKSLLKKLAGQGIDVTNFRPAVTPGGLAAQKARAAVSYHAKAGFQKKKQCYFTESEEPFQKRIRNISIIWKPI